MSAPREAAVRDEPSSPPAPAGGAAIAPGEPGGSSVEAEMRPGVCTCKPAVIRGGKNLLHASDCGRIVGRIERVSSGVHNVRPDGAQPWTEASPPYPLKCETGRAGNDLESGSKEPAGVVPSLPVGAATEHDALCDLMLAGAQYLAAGQNAQGRGQARARLRDSIQGAVMALGLDAPPVIVCRPASEPLRAPEGDE